MNRTFCEIALFVADVPAAASFYAAILKRQPELATESMAIFTAGGLKLLIHLRYTPRTGELPCEDHIAIAVPDVDAAASEIAAQGYPVEVPPRDVPWGRSAYLRDPNGRLIEIQRQT